MLATGDGYGKICLWDAATGYNLATFREEYKVVASLAFSPDGQTLASESNGRIKLWDVKRRMLKYENSGHSHRVNTLVFTPDGQILVSASYGGEIILWDVATGERKTTFPRNGTAVLTVGLNPNGGILVSAGLSKDNSIHLYDPINGEVKMTLKGHWGDYVNAAFNSDSTLLTTADENGIILLWDVSSIFYPTLHRSDVNDDGIIDLQDLVIVALNFGQTGPNKADVNDDGIVNIDDLIKVAAAIENDAAAAPMVFNHILSPIKVGDLQHWLTQAQQLDLSDATSQKGIRFLEQLLLTLTPTKTALLPNYPNPFNPETWIPYQLAEPADVSVQIYSSNGELIHTLVLGHKSAGLFQQRDRAAYWDGKNEHGEPVASGVYFSKLSAGQFTATRRMVIRK